MARLLRLACRFETVDELGNSLSVAVIVNQRVADRRQGIGYCRAAKVDNNCQISAVFESGPDGYARWCGINRIARVLCFRLDRILALDGMPIKGALNATCQECIFQ